MSYTMFNPEVFGTTTATAARGVGVATLAVASTGTLTLSAGQQVRLSIYRGADLYTATKLGHLAATGVVGLNFEGVTEIDGSADFAVQVGDFVVMNVTAETINEINTGLASISSSLGTASGKAASGSGGTVASVQGSPTVGHIAVFEDGSGTVGDGGPVPTSPVSSVAGRNGAVVLSASDVGGLSSAITSAISTATITESQVTGLAGALSGLIPTSAYNQPNGVPQLDGSGNLVGNLICTIETASTLAGTIPAQGQLVYVSDYPALVVGDGTTTGGRSVGGAEILCDLVTNGAGTPANANSANTGPYNASTNPVVIVQDTAGTGVNLPFLYAYRNKYSCFSLGAGTFTAPRDGVYAFRMSVPLLVIDNTTGGNPTTDTAAKWSVVAALPEFESTYPTINANLLDIFFQHGSSAFNVFGPFYFVGTDTTLTTSPLDTTGSWVTTVPLAAGQVIQWKFTNLRADTLSFRVHQRIQIWSV